MKRGVYYQKKEDNTGIIKRLISPYTWIQASLYGIGNPPIEMPIKLLDTLQKSEAAISCLHYDLLYGGIYRAFEFSAEDLQCLNVAVQNLKVLRIPHFRGGLGNRSPEDLDDLDALRSFMTAILDVASLEEIYVALGFLSKEREYPPLFSLISLALPRKYPKLRSLSLISVNMHLWELEDLLSPSNPSLVSVSLDYPCLLGGTWKEALELLRERNLSYFDLKNPLGAELNNMPAEKGGDVFGRPGAFEDSAANKYILGRIDRNPLE